MAILGFIFLVIALALIGVGFAIGAGVFAVTCLAAALGMISTSVTVGILQKRPSAGFCVFCYQFFILSFVTVGVFFSCLLPTVLDLPLSLGLRLFIGALSGLATGLLFGLLHSWIIDLIVLHLPRRLLKAAPATRVGAVVSPQPAHP